MGGLLVTNTQTSAFVGPNGGSLPNKTNLAIKCIIGIEAMSVISSKYLNNTMKAKNGLVRLKCSFLMLA